MRFVVVGAGGVGSFVGASLARAGHDVTLVGRGAHFRAVAANGLEVRGVRASFDVRIATADDVARVAKPDVVLLAVKAHQIAPLAQRLADLARHDECTLVTMQNGVPFWFFDSFGGRIAGTHLDSVDPGGAIASAIDVRCIVACVVDAGTRIPRAGTVEQVGHLSYALGEPNGADTPRLRELVSAFASAGLDARADPEIRRSVWSKVVGNAALNPISALTRATAEQIVDDAALVAVMRAAMEELVAVGVALGLAPLVSSEARIAATRAYGDQRTSMLQDLEAGRPMEIDPIVGAAVEIAGLVGVDVPTTRSLYALTQLLDRGMSARRREA